MKLAYVGSFDPFTNGHLHVINKALHLGKDVGVLVIVANNDRKKHNFKQFKRVQVIQDVIESEKLSNQVHVMELTGTQYAVDFAMNQGCTALLRGIRTEQDFQDEVGFYHANRLVNSEMESVYVMPDMNLSGVRSSLVMSMVGFKNWTNVVDELVPDSVMLELCKNWCCDMVQFNSMMLNVDEVYKKFHYHNWQHIAYCLSEVYDNKNLINGKFYEDFMEAVLFHDFYDPANLPSNNEYLKYGKSMNFNFVMKLIAATNHGKHDALVNKEEKLIHDIDLSVLAWKHNDYVKYMKNIQNEYIVEKCVDKLLFKDGRIKFLEEMLNEDKIFELDIYSEKQAKENMKFEFDELKKW